MMMEKLNLSQLEYDNVVADRSSIELFKFTILSEDFAYRLGNKFKINNVNVFTKFDAIDGYTSLYDILLTRPFTYKEHCLFFFAANRLCINDKEKLL